MLTYEICRYIFIGGAVLSGIMLVVTILLFIFLKIPMVIGDLTGANARKAIANIRNQNESSGNKTYQTSQVNRERGKLTDKITASGRLIKNPSHSLHGAMATEKISTQQLLPTDAPASETTLLGNEQPANETTLLGNAPTASETTVLSAENAPSAVSAPAGETAVLEQQSNVFEIEYEITYIHTNEIIS